VHRVRLLRARRRGRDDGDVEARQEVFVHQVPVEIPRLVAEGSDVGDGREGAGAFQGGCEQKDGREEEEAAHSLVSVDLNSRVGSATHKSSLAHWQLAGVRPRSGARLEPARGPGREAAQPMLDGVECGYPPVTSPELLMPKAVEDCPLKRRTIDPPLQSRRSG